MNVYMYMYVDMESMLTLIFLFYDRNYRAAPARTIWKTRVCINQQLFSSLYLTADGGKEYTKTEWNFGILSEQNSKKNTACEES